ncbi:MAG: hypothetical protein ACREQZ_01005 [Woeseiaceae bacterium]
MQTIGLRIFDCPIRIETRDTLALKLVAACYSAFFDADAGADPSALRCTIEARAGGGAWQVLLGGAETGCNDVVDLVYALEKGLTIELQTLRRDLFFVHAAVVEMGPGSTLIAGASGAGKSTLCWGLCNEGCAYLSDELAPIDLAGMRIIPYPHALCLKGITGGGYAAPADCFRTPVTLHIPSERMPGGVAREPLPVANIVFLTGDPATGPSGLEEISHSEAAARLYATSLNQLAHEKDGLKAASRLAGAARCFCIGRAELPAMRRELLRLIGNRRSTDFQ